MRTTIDTAGRIVIPKAMRDEVGLRAGEVEIRVDGAFVRIEPVTDDHLEERDGRLVIPADGATLTDEDVRALLESGRR